jgi:CRISPR-associated protein Csb1
MKDLLTTFDDWLDHSGPAALVIHEYLVPVEGPDGVLFPPTFAAASGDGFPGGYNVDELGDGRNVCLIDSVGSQANRIEPMFAAKPYAGLVPQVVITAGCRKVNLLEAGHRAGDAIVRCSGLQEELQAAFLAAQTGDTEPLAKIAPTSLVFGVWDSRGTQAKSPRLIASTIRAFDVKRLTRSAQYVPAVDYITLGLLEDPADKQTKDAYSERGFAHVPASHTHGGVIATGGIRRNATLHLAALRLLRCKDDEVRTLALRRYIFGLSLTAFTLPACGYLRQGCNLVADPGRAREFKAVYPDGRREDAKLTHDDAFAYACAAASAFGIDPDRTIDGTEPDKEVSFEREAAGREIRGEGEAAGRTARKAAARKSK